MPAPEGAKGGWPCPCGCADKGAKGEEEEGEAGGEVWQVCPPPVESDLAITPRNPLDKFSYLCRPDDDIIFNTAALTLSVCVCVCIRGVWLINVCLCLCVCDLCCNFFM